MSNKTKRNKKGFTLVELLVVILIIGILSSIALIQFQKVFIKSRTDQFFLILNGIHKAQQRYFLTTETYATKFSQLDVNFQDFSTDYCDTTFKGFPKSDCLSKGEMTILLSTTYGTAIYAIFNQGKYKLAGIVYQEEENGKLPRDRILCYRNNGFCTDILGCKLYKQLNVYDYYYDCNL